MNGTKVPITNGVWTLDFSLYNFDFAGDFHQITEKYWTTASKLEPYDLYRNKPL